MGLLPRPQNRRLFPSPSPPPLPSFAHIRPENLFLRLSFGLSTVLTPLPLAPLSSSSCSSSSSFPMRILLLIALRDLPYLSSPLLLLPPPLLLLLLSWPNTSFDLYLCGERRRSRAASQSLSSCGSSVSMPHHWRCKEVEVEEEEEEEEESPTFS